MKPTTFPLWMFGITALFVVAEMLWSRRTGRGVYNTRETLANTAIFVGGQLVGPASIAWKTLVLGAIGGLAPFHWERGPALFIVTFLATDLVYYASHRLQHEVKALWPLHVVHHSSPWMNLTTSFRISWVLPFVGFIVYAPLVLLGLPNELIGISLALNLTFQFFLHTEAVRTLGPLEGILNTPSAHRVHHGSNPLYLDKNYGGVLMIWDRLFGTWQPETEPVRYGITTGFKGHNPLYLMFHGFIDYARSRRAAQVGGMEEVGTPTPELA